MPYCNQCGVPLEENASFCIECGAPQVSAEMPQNPPKKGLHLLLKIGIPALAIIIIAIVVIFLFVRISPLATTGIALINLESEMAQRLNSTPLRAATMTTEKLENGTLTLNLDYSDRWSDIEATATIISNSITRDHALALEVDIGRNTFTAEAFLNRTRLAIGSAMVDDNFYGITFSTFREDIRTFGREIGMDRHTMETLADIVELLEMAMNSDDVEDTLLAPYVRLLTAFVMNLDPTSERTQIYSGGDNVNVRRIEYIITADDIITLLTDIVDLMSSDDELRDFYNSFIDDLGPSSNFGWRLFRTWATPSYNEIMIELRDAVQEFGRALSGEITTSFYIGSRNRLVRMESDVNMRFYGERIRIFILNDFGTSAQDSWVFTINTTFAGHRTSNEIVWDYEVRANRVINTVTITTGYRQQADEVTFVSDWSRDNGRFTLSYESRWSSGEITGIFTYGRSDFRLVIDNPLADGGFLNQRLDFEIVGTTENQIRDIDFINIDLWTEKLFEDIDNALWGSGFSLFRLLRGDIGFW